jgi:predicted permease
LAVFNVIRGLWYPNGIIRSVDRLVFLLTDVSSRPDTDGNMSRGTLHRLAVAPAFEMVAGQVTTSGRNARYEPVISVDGVGAVEALAVTPEYFSTLGISVVGRDFSASDDNPGGIATAIVSDRLWRRLFGGQPFRPVKVDAKPTSFDVIGMAPQGFQGARLGERADLWIPSSLVPVVAREGMANFDLPFLGIARMRPGVTATVAEQDLAKVASSMAFPLSGRNVPTFRILRLTHMFGSPGSRSIVMTHDRVLTLASVGAALVLGSACVTLFALTVVDLDRRRNEFATRRALGASSEVLAQQLMAELGGPLLCGTGMALAIASLVGEIMPSVTIAGGVDLSRLNLSMSLFLVTLGALLSGIAYLIAAGVPILMSTKMPVSAALALSSRTTSRTIRLKQFALGAQTAVTVFVLIYAALFARTVHRAYGNYSGLDIGHALFVRGLVRPAFLGARINFDKWQESHAAKVRQLIEDIKATPSFSTVAVGPSPIGPDQLLMTMQPTNITFGGGQKAVRILQAAVTPEYFEATGIRLIAGRAFSASDMAQWIPGTPDKAIVTTALAEELFSRGSALGQRLVFPGGFEYEIVGIVEEFIAGSVVNPCRAALFTATTVESSAVSGSLTLAARTIGEAGASADLLRRKITLAFPQAAQLDVSTGSEVISRDLSKERLGAWFFGGFGLCGLIIGITGITGLVLYVIESRLKELAIRLSLGATLGSVTFILLRSVVLPTAIGGIIGVTSVLLCSQIIAATAGTVDVSDRMSYVLAIVIMLIAGCVGSLPAVIRLRRMSLAGLLNGT